MGWFPSGLNGPVDPNDRLAKRHLQGKILHLTDTPFDDSKTEFELERHETNRAVEEEETEAEAVPPWLELFFDLAWTTTFSSLTANTPINSPTTVASYVVFFCLAWWLWVSQVLYDTKYFCNDWLHRIFLLFQFCLFGGLAAFTQGFDITQGLTSNDDDDAASSAVTDAYIARAFLAIPMIFAISRILLALQYIRVLRYAKQRRVYDLYVIVGTLFASTALFIGAFATLKANPDLRIAHILKFVFWFLAIFIEIMAYLFTDMPRGLVREGSMPERLATLTTVVLGEGLNGLVDPVVAAAKSVGFNAKVAAQIFMVALLVFVVFILYFSSYQTKMAPSSARQKAVVLLHFPIQLSIILLLEGMKAILNVTTLLNSFEYFVELAGGANTTEALSAGLLSIGINYTAAANEFSTLATEDLNLAANGTVTANEDDGDDDTGDDDTDARKRQANSDGSGDDGTDDGDNDDNPILDTDVGLRLFADALESIADNFNVIDDGAKKEWDTYINDQAPNSKAYADAVAANQANFTGLFGPTLDSLLEPILDNQTAPVQWISPVAGLLLFTLAITMVVNGMSWNRYTTWSVIARILTGVCLTLLAVINNFPDASGNWLEEGWFLPTIVLFYIALFFADYIIAVLMAKNLQQRREWTLPRVFVGPNQSGPSPKSSQHFNPYNPSTYPEGHRI